MSDHQPTPDVKRRMTAGAELLRQHAVDDIELEHPPTGIRVGEGLRRLRRRNKLIDWLLTVLIVAMPVALLVLSTLVVKVNGRAERAVVAAGQAREAATESKKAADASQATLDGLTATNDRLTALVESFGGLATATTPAEQQAARAAIVAQLPATTTTTTPRAKTPSTSTSTTTTQAPATATTTTTTSPPATTTTTQPAPTTTTTAPCAGIRLAGACIGG